MDLHCPLAPQVRQTIQFPLPAPELAGAGRFLVPNTAKSQTPPEPVAQGRKQVGLLTTRKVQSPNSNAQKAGGPHPPFSANVGLQTINAC